MRNLLRNREDRSWRNNVRVEGFLEPPWMTKVRQKSSKRKQKFSDKYLTKQTKQIKEKYKNLEFFPKQQRKKLKNFNILN